MPANPLPPSSPLPPPFLPPKSLGSRQFWQMAMIRLSDICLGNVLLSFLPSPPQNMKFHGSRTEAYGGAIDSGFQTVREFVNIFPPPSLPFLSSLSFLLILKVTGRGEGEEELFLLTGSQQRSSAEDNQLIPFLRVLRKHCQNSKAGCFRHTGEGGGREKRLWYFFYKKLLPRTVKENKRNRRIKRIGKKRLPQELLSQ